MYATTSQSGPVSGTLSGGLVQAPDGLLVEHLPLVTYALLLEPPFPALYVSPQLEPLFGYAPGDCVGDFWSERIDPEDRALLRAALLRSHETREPMSVEYRVSTADNRLVWVRDVAVVAEADDGSLRLHGYLTDVSREKELERELAAERAQADAFFRDSSVGLAITDAHGRYLRVNDALAELTQRPPEEHLGRTLAELAPEIAARVGAVHDEVSATGAAVHQHEVEIELRDGTLRTALLSVFPLDLGGERHYGRIVTDITEQRRAESERAAAQEQYRRLIEQLPLVTYVNDIEPHYRTRYVSPQIEEVYGHPAADWLADPDLWDRVVHPDDFEKVSRLEEEARERREPFELEYRIVRADGTVGWVLDLMETVYDAAGHPLYDQGFIVDITTRRESENLFRAIFDSAFEGMIITDDHGCYVDANSAACELYGRSRETLIGLSAANVTPPGFDFASAWRAFLELGAAAGEIAVSRPDGTTRDVEYAAKANVLPGLHISVLRDVTQRKQLQRDLWRAQRLESVGRLAGGVAQDFNNMLTAIRGYAQLLQVRATAGTVEHDHAHEIDRAAERAATLTAQLLAFGRRQTLQERPVELNRLIEELEPMLRGLVDGRGLVVDLDPALHAVRVDPAQVRQALLSLVSNAVDATPEEGRVVVRTHSAEIGDGELADLPAGRYAVVAVEDAGRGIDESTLEHIFEPFFTTKEVGGGTGLGLSTAYGIVRQSGGTIMVATEPGRGSTFSVYLPEAPPAYDSFAVGATGETILVVENDPAVRDVVYELLSEGGYRVITAPTAGEAIRLAERLDGPIDLLLSDADSRVHGLVGALNELRPALRALSLQKPYTPDRLRAEVRDALDVARSSDGDTRIGLRRSTTSG